MPRCLISIPPDNETTSPPTPTLPTQITNCWASCMSYSPALNKMSSAALEDSGEPFNSSSELNLTHIHVQLYMIRIMDNWTETLSNFEF